MVYYNNFLKLFLCNLLFMDLLVWTADNLVKHFDIQNTTNHT